MQANAMDPVILHRQPLRDALPAGREEGRSASADGARDPAPGRGVSRNVQGKV